MVDRGDDVTRYGMNTNLERWRVQGLWLGAMAICPVWALQGVYVRRVAIRLPSAEGPREGETGKGGDVLSLAVLGDSTVAGVGAATQELGLPAQVAEEIRKLTGRCVRWQAVGKHGATAASAGDALVSRLREDKIDLMAVVLGANDALEFTSVRTFRRSIARFVATLRRHSSCPIVFSTLPPLQRFSLFPQPLRATLGLRVRLLNGELQALTYSDPTIVYAPVRFPVEDRFMARDGLHPSEVGYHEWARQLADCIVDNELIAETP
jgi:lysophospholipase L1-like esterase